MRRQCDKTPYIRGDLSSSIRRSVLNIKVSDEPQTSAEIKTMERRTIEHVGKGHPTDTRRIDMRGATAP